MKKLLSVISGLAAILLCASCDVHQFPGENPVDPTLVNLHINLIPAAPMSLYDNGQALVETRDYVVPDTDNIARYVVEIYKDEKFSRDLVYSTVVTRPESKLPDTLKLDAVKLNALHYRVCVWQDLRPEASVGVDRFYVTTNGLAKIAQRPVSQYNGSSDSKNAQTATYKLDLSSYGVEWDVNVNCDVPLRRPLGKMVLVAADLAKFMKTCIENSAGASLSDFRTRVEYQLYIPTGYDVPNWDRYWNENLNASSLGYCFENAIVPIDGDSAIVGFDYILMDTRATSVRVKVATINTKTGEVINNSREFEVPLKPNQITVIRGDMLTLDTGGGIGIDPEFDGEFNIYV